MEFNFGSKSGNQRNKDWQNMWSLSIKKKKKGKYNPVGYGVINEKFLNKLQEQQ